MSRIAYKGFKLNGNNQLQCRDMIYELNKKYSIDDKLKLHENGMHFCWKLRDVDWYYDFRDSAICEVEILGDIVEGKNKACTNKLKILRILSKDEVMELSNDGIGNNGYCNKGNNNKGDYNIGDNNTGYFNKGNNNTGNGNVGDGNEGNWNKGDRNNGYFNTGSNNQGDNNVGNNNKGKWNKGDNNTGSYNTGNNIIGFFNTISDIGSLDNIAIFNKLSNISMEEFKQMEVYKIIDLGLRHMWEHLNDEDKKLILQLPNFDKDIFKEITRVEM